MPRVAADLVRTAVTIGWGEVKKLKEDDQERWLSLPASEQVRVVSEFLTSSGGLVLGRLEEGAHAARIDRPCLRVIEKGSAFYLPDRTSCDIFFHEKCHKKCANGRKMCLLSQRPPW